MNYHLYKGIEEVNIKSKNVVKRDIYELWQESFWDTDIYTDFYFEWKITDNQVLLLYKDMQLVAMLHLNPYTLMVKGKELSANYIVGVATKESERRKGLMKRLIEASMETMYNKKMPFTYLMPVKESIYLPFDFSVIYEQPLWNHQLIDIKNEEKSKRDKSDQSDYKILVLETDDTTKINNLVSFTNKLLYNEYEIFVKRDTHYYKRLINEMRSSEGEVLVCYKHNIPVGYLSYMAEEAIYITELISYKEDEKELFRMFLDYISSNEHLKDKKIFKKKKGSQETVIMVRIINLQEFIKILTAKTYVSFVVDITDPIIENNQGRFLIEIDKGGGHIEPTSKEPDMFINIADLAKLFFGKLIEEKLETINFYNKTFINDVV